jgi:murein DD-endopeptidase MepM/ murein hydrolase activator NlpD
VIVLSALAIAVPAAVAADLPTPVLAPGAPPAGAPATPVTAAPPQSTAPTGLTATPLLGLRTLRAGMRGPDVRELQRELRRRGLRVTADGAYGPRTRAAVRLLQRRLGLTATGIADLRLLQRIGLRTRAVASGTGVAPTATTLGAQAPAPAGTTRVGRYLKTFPLQGEHTYYDDFGEPRGQGPHQGVDIMSPRNTPIVAVAAGVIERLTRVETGLGGIWIWLRDTAGNEYFYAHLESIEAGLQPGTKVAVGQRIGYVGNSGDARYGATHLHFELHPGGGAAVSPYQELLTVDPTPPAPKG